MILRLGAKLTVAGLLDFSIDVDVMESKNSAALILVLDGPISMRESTGDWDTFFGVGDTGNWRLSTS